MSSVEPEIRPPATRAEKLARFFNVCLVPALTISWIILSWYFSYNVLKNQTSVGLTDGAGHPFGDCFINFWAAAKLAATGHIGEVYNWNAFHEFQESIVGATLVPFHYSYPPVMPLLTLPLAALPYAQAFIVWLVATWAFFYLALRVTRPSVGALFLSLATPAFLFNAVAGQNGALTAALLGGGLALLPKRPVIAGILFGCLCFKPQLVFLLPVALVCGRYWKTLAAAAVTSILFVALSLVLYGPGIWLDYLHRTQMLRHYVLEDNTAHSWQQFVSVFVAARQLGAGIMPAYAAQFLFALLALFAVVKLWREGAAYELRCAALVIGTFMATPYVMEYDLVVTAFVAVWLKRSFANYKFAAALMLAAPVVSTLLGNYAGFSAGPLLLLPGFLLVLGSCGVPGLGPKRSAS